MQWMIAMDAIHALETPSQNGQERWTSPLCTFFFLLTKNDFNTPPRLTVVSIMILPRGPLGLNFKPLRNVFLYSL
jgi:hypothetical protein